MEYKKAKGDPINGGTDDSSSGVGNIGIIFKALLPSVRASQSLDGQTLAAARC